MWIPQQGPLSCAVGAKRGPRICCISGVIRPCKEDDTLDFDLFRPAFFCFCSATPQSVGAASPSVRHLRHGRWRYQKKRRSRSNVVVGRHHVTSVLLAVYETYKKTAVEYSISRHALIASCDLASGQCKETAPVGKESPDERRHTHGCAPMGCAG